MNKAVAELSEEELAAVAFDDAVAAGKTPQAALSQAIADYPAAASFLSDYALSVIAVGAQEASAELTEIESVVMSRADMLLAKRIAPVTGKALRAGILGLAKQQGLTLTALAEALGLGRSVIVKLDRRLIDAATVPASALSRIADAIGAASSDIRAYLALPPTMAAGASYKATDTPATAPEQQAFADAVSTALLSGEMDDASAAAWRK
ncbi:MAG TPA: hypothetical protein VGK19_23130 [Capsulimonadaceae bacterium]|jgi:hypothetical protein